MLTPEKEPESTGVGPVEIPTTVSAEDAASVKGGAGFSGVIETIAVKYIKFTDIELKSTK